MLDSNRVREYVKSFNFIKLFVSCDWSETRISDIVSILKEETFK
jgi:hypothetical protein